MVATKCERRRGHYPKIGYLTSFHSLCKYCFGGVCSLRYLLIWSLITCLRYSVNSRRSLAESSRDSDDFGTFGLSGQHKISQRQRMPVRMEIFDAPRSDTEGSDFHLKVPSTGAELDGIQVISMAVWLYRMTTIACTWNSISEYQPHSECSQHCAKSMRCYSAL